VQTPESIKMSPVEEAYELLEAVNLKDDDKILEESGDIMLQAVFYAVMKEQEKAFNFTDMVTSECDKMITRHTHIFGADKADSEESALSVWEKNKMKEKHQDTYSAAVNDVPATFPALLKAQKTIRRMAKGGWSCGDLNGIKNRLKAEADELAAFGDKKYISEKAGELLMDAVRLGAAAGVNCEEALLDAVERAKKLFSAFEKFALKDGKDVADLTAEEWNYYYSKAKNAVKEN